MPTITGPRTLDAAKDTTTAAAAETSATVVARAARPRRSVDMGVKRRSYPTC